MTVIYGFINDTDTKVLSYIWEGIANVKVLKTYESSQKDIDEAVKNEKDVLILCGHGSDEGLFGKNMYAVDKNSEINAKYVIGVWCHAKQFAKKYHIKGFFTSMYISNMGEAIFELRNKIRTLSFTDKDITAGEIKFCKLLNSYLKTYIEKHTDLDLPNWPKRILETIPPKNIVEKYNHENLEYIN